MEVLDEDARIFLFHNFLTPEECDHIRGLAEPQLARSGVIADEEGNSGVSNVRTSSGMFLERGQDAIVADIERRIARWTLIPVNHGEGLQVLRYQKTQKYEGHMDSFSDKHSAENGGNRMDTVLT
jgi:prolyl 4-hydroxylase